jgi:hypothetical protein
MAARHRIPTVFSIYMLDVLCCALGCVILLWQVDHQEAEMQTAAATTRGDALQTAVDQLKNANISIDSLAGENKTLKITSDTFKSKSDKLAADLEATKSELDASKKKAVQVTLLLDDERKGRDAEAKLALVLKKEYELLKQTHALVQGSLDKLKDQSKDVESKSNLTAQELAAKIKQNAALLAELADVQKLRDALGKEKIEMLAKLKTSELRTRLLEDDLTRARLESSEADKKIAELLKDNEATRSRMNISAKDAESLRQAIAKLSDENFEALRRMKQIQAAAENRFAGITLTGKKIIFLVDMSGSMELADENTADPDKWPFLCETIARILQSLNDVTHYQVILFSDKIRYAFGNEGKWLETKDRVQDAKAIAAQLKTVKPQGPTNMYAAFEEAFKFRNQGLDTIYVLSDGLPNAGPGLPANPPAKLDEQMITTLLSKHLRAKLKNEWNPKTASPRIRINTLGFFYESPDVGAFLWALSREHDGSFVGMR